MESDTMIEEDVKALERAAKKAKRIATERAGELHDLIEDRLPAAYEDLPAMAQATYDACREWAALEAQLKAAEAAA
jgi:hypothetical protein